MRVALAHRWLATQTMGGVSRLYTTLARELRSLGVDVVTISQYPFAEGDHVIVHAATRLDACGYGAALAAVVGRLGVELVECSSWEAELLEFSQVCPTAVVVRCEYPCTMLGAAVPQWRRERALALRAHRVVAVSRYARERFALAYGVTPCLVLNGVSRGTLHTRSRRPMHLIAAESSVTIPEHWSNTHFLPRHRLRLPSDWRPDVIWIGKITPSKGWRLLESVIRRSPELRFAIVLGHAPILACPSVSRPGERLVLLQDVPDVDLFELVSGSGVLLSTSVVEGFGLAAAEALVCGTPVVAPSWLRSFHEFVDVGVDGDTFRCVDEAAMLLRGWVGRRATGRHVPSAREMGRRTLELYEEVLGGGRQQWPRPHLSGDRSPAQTHG